MRGGRRPLPRLRRHLDHGRWVASFSLVLVQVRLVGPANDRLGEAGASRTGLASNAIGLLLLAVNWGWALLCAGRGLVTPTLSSAVGHRAHADRRGSAHGFQQSAGGLARVVGPALAGLLFQDGGTADPYLVGAALVIAALAMVPGVTGDRQLSYVTER